MNLRILIVDDDPAMRRALQDLLARTPATRVVGEAADGDEVPAQIDACHPDVILMDVQMRRTGGIPATRNLAAARPSPNCPTTAAGPKVLLMSLHTDDRMIAEGLRAGAAGFLFKTRLNHDLLPALHALHHGQRFVSHSPVTAPGNHPTLWYRPHPPQSPHELARQS